MFDLCVVHHSSRSEEHVEHLFGHSGAMVDRRKKNANCQLIFEIEGYSRRHISFPRFYFGREKG
jgi:hypothetical protein